MSRYHWAIIIGPKKETPASQGLLCQVKNGTCPQSGWQYKYRQIAMAPTRRPLVRLMVGKIKNRGRLEAVLRNTPIRPETSGWNCVEWVKEALENAGRDGEALGTAATADWQSVRDGILRYMDSKHASGRFDRNYDATRAPTWDLVESKELVP